MGDSNKMLKESKIKVNTSLPDNIQASNITKIAKNQIIVRKDAMLSTSYQGGVQGNDSIAANANNLIVKKQGISDHANKKRKLVNVLKVNIEPIEG